jgi:glutamyl-tRNA synthetase
MTPVRGRYAPSPTGLLHLGNVRTALVAWLSARAARGSFILRVEDIDAPRIQPGAEEDILETLRWLGIDWDEGPDVSGPHAPYRQSARTEMYEEALSRLHDSDHLFPCHLSRKDLQEIASAPHSAASPYPPELRPDSVEPDWFERFENDGMGHAAIRFRVQSGEEVFRDRVHGQVNQNVAEETGDFVLKRRDGVFAYQLAVVVDDLAMGITEIVRGDDLLHATGRQIQLIRALGGNPPTYMHVPLLLSDAGEKLCKRDSALTLQALRTRGITADAIIGSLAWSLGLQGEPAPCRPADLIPGFDPARIIRRPFTVRSADIPFGDTG